MPVSFPKSLDADDDVMQWRRSVAHASRLFVTGFNAPIGFGEQLSNRVEAYGSFFRVLVLMMCAVMMPDNQQDPVSVHPRTESL